MEPGFEEVGDDVSLLVAQRSAEVQNVIQVVVKETR
jgi:hypothetical protein